MTKNRNQGYDGFFASGGGTGVFAINDIYNRDAFPIPNKISPRRKNLVEPRVGIMQTSMLALMRHFRKLKT